MKLRMGFLEPKTSILTSCEKNTPIEFVTAMSILVNNPTVAYDINFELR